MAVSVSLTRQKYEDTIVTNDYIDFMSTQPQLQMKMCSFKNMMKLEFSKIIEPFMRNTKLSNFQFTNYIIDNINLDFAINGAYMYYVQEQLFYGAYRTFIECARYDNRIKFDEKLIRDNIASMLFRLSSMFMSEAQNGMQY